MYESFVKISSAVWPTKALIKKIKKQRQNITWTLAERASITTAHYSVNLCLNALEIAAAIVLKSIARWLQQNDFYAGILLRSTNQSRSSWVVSRVGDTVSPVWILLEITHCTFHLTYFNIWRGGPPGRRTNRPTWQMPGGPVRPRACLPRDMTLHFCTFNDSKYLTNFASYSG